MAISIVDLFSALNISVTTTGDKATKSNAAFSGSMTLITGSTTISGSASMTFPNASTIDDNDEIIAYFRDYSSSVVGGTVKWSINRVGVKDNSLKLLTPTTEATGYGNEFISDVERNYIPAGTYDRFQTSLGYSDWSGSGYTFNGKIFDSYESAKAYAETGDTSGQIFNYSPPQVTCNIIKYFNSINEEAGPKTAYGKSTGYGCTMQNYNAQMFMEYTASSFHPKFIASYKASEGETSTDEVCMFIESWPITEYDGSVGWGDHACIGLCRINRLNNQLTVIHSNEWDADIDTSMDGGWYDSRSYANGFVFAGNHWGRWMVSERYCPIGYEYIIAMHLTFNGKIFDSLEGAQKYANDETDLSGQIWAYAPYAGANEFDFYYRSRYGAEFPWDESEPIYDYPEITSTESHAGSPENPSKNIQPISQTVYDSVYLNNLIVGLEFTIAVLVGIRTETGADEALGDPTYVTFTATDLAMQIDVPITIDATGYEETKLVFLTYLLYGEEIISAHDDPFNEHEFLYVQTEEPEEEDDEEYGDYSGYVVDSSFNNIGPIENYNSLIWTDRYSKCGDFEIYAPYDSTLFNTLQIDNYIFIPESQRYMVIEKVEISATTNEGTKMIISGRSLESILDRRVVWNKTTIDGSLEDGIHTLLNENIISPATTTEESAKRKISNFIFKASDDPEIEALELQSQYIGDNLYDLITEICHSNGIGFKVTLDSDRNFVFQLYKGIDRTLQNTLNNNVVIFSPELDNMVDCDYIKSKEKMKNVCRIAGEGDGNDQIFSYYSKDTKGGLYRRETYISASGLSKEYSDNVGERQEMTDEQYKQALLQRGREEISELGMALSIDGTMYTTVDGAMFTYGKDFDLGDVIECSDTVGNNMKARISEIIITRNSNGYTVYPTFESVNNETILIFGRMSTYADNAKQPFTNSILISEYFTYNPTTCTYTCLKATGKCELRMDWKWGKYPDDTKQDSIMDVYKNNDSFYHFEIPNWVDGSRTIDISFNAGDTFYLHKEQHGNAYFTAMKIVQVEED